MFANKFKKTLSVCVSIAINSILRISANAWATFYLATLAFSLYGAIGVSVSYTWDAGNLMYPTGAFEQHKLPNIDFVYGYPGLSIYFESKIAELLNVSALEVNSNAFFLFNFLSALASFYILKYLTNIYGAILGASLIIIIGIHYPFNNPGNYINIIYLIFICLKIRVKKWPSDYLIGAINGISIAFKQSAIFLFIGSLSAIALERKSRYFLFLVVFLNLILIFLFLRNSQNLFLSISITISMIYACYVYYKKSNANFNENLFKRIISINVVAVIIFLMIICIVYWARLDISGILYQIFINVPPLISRDATKNPQYIYDYIYYVNALFFLLAMLFIKYYKNIIKINYILIILTALDIFLNYWMSSYYNMPINYNQIFLSLLTPKFIAVYSIINFYYIDNSKIDTDKILIIFLSTSILMSNIIFENIYSFTPFLVINFIFFITYSIDNTRVVFYKKYSHLIYIFLIIISVLYSYSTAKNYNKSLSYQTIHGEIIGYQKDQKPFIDAAKWLSLNTNFYDYVYGYPNFGLTFYLSKRFNNGFYPNFIGSIADYNNIIDIIEGNNPPKYFIFSTSNYPYGLDHPYFPSGIKIYESLSNKYNEVYIVEYNNEVQAKIFKLK